MNKQCLCSSHTRVDQESVIKRWMWKGSKCYWIKKQIEPFSHSLFDVDLIKPLNITRYTSNVQENQLTNGLTWSSFFPKNISRDKLKIAHPKPNIFFKTEQLFSNLLSYRILCHLLKKSLQKYTFSSMLSIIMILEWFLN